MRPPGEFKMQPLLEAELPAVVAGIGLASVAIGNTAPPIGAKIKVNATTTAKVCRSLAEKWTIEERSGRLNPLTSFLIVCKTNPSSKKMHFF